MPWSCAALSLSWPGHCKTCWSSTPCSRTWLPSTGSLPGMLCCPTTTWSTCWSLDSSLLGTASCNIGCPALQTLTRLPDGSWAGRSATACHKNDFALCSLTIGSELAKNSLTANARVPAYQNDVLHILHNHQMQGRLTILLMVICPASLEQYIRATGLLGTCFTEVMSNQQDC